MSKSEQSENCVVVSRYKCEKCRDLTFIIEDGVATPCECRALKEASYILENSGVSEEFRKKSFENFNYAYDMQTIEAYRKASLYVREFESVRDSRSNSIMFVGQVGSGKTHLSMAIANSLMDDGVGVVYMPYRDVVTRLKQNIMDEEYYQRAVGRYKRAKVLLIDDLFKGKLSESDVNIIFEIVNYRYFNNLPVIVSSEKGMEELVEIDEAIGSRLIEMCKDNVLEMKGKRLNYRIYGG